MSKPNPALPSALHRFAPNLAVPPGGAISMPGLREVPAAAVADEIRIVLVQAMGHRLAQRMDEPLREFRSCVGAVWCTRPLTFLPISGEAVLCPGTEDSRLERTMKSQDLLVLLRLVSLELTEVRLTARVKDAESVAAKLPFDWKGWETEPPEVKYFSEPDLNDAAASDRHSARALAEALAISKTEVSASLRRSLDVGLARRDRHSGLPRANRSALLELGEHCLRWVFPVRPGPLARGIPTGFAAPVLADQVLSAGQNPYVWPDARGKATGQSITPLYKSVPLAVRRDADLYAMLAVLDALRLGQPRERAIARDRLASLLGLA